MKLSVVSPLQLSSFSGTVVPMFEFSSQSKSEQIALPFGSQIAKSESLLLADYSTLNQSEFHARSLLIRPAGIGG